MFSASFLLLLLTSVLGQECPLSPQCADKQYLDADLSECKSLPSDFTVEFNATEYIIYTCVGENQDAIIPADEILFTLAIYINNNTATASDVFNLDLPDNKLKFQSTGDADDDITFTDNYHLFNTYEYTVMTASSLTIEHVYNTVIQLQSFSNPIYVVSEITIKNMTIPMYQCNGTECLNGGTCVPATYDNYTCACIEGYEGDECEQESDPCNPNPCQYNGNCSSISNTVHMCECMSGYTGQDCTIDIDECALLNCGNGTCMDLINDYQCVCDPGYTGDHCTNTIITDTPTSSVSATHTTVIPSRTSETASYDTTGTSLRSSTTASVVPSPPPDSETSLSMFVAVTIAVVVTVVVTVVITVPVTVVATLLLVRRRQNNVHQQQNNAHQQPPRADEGDHQL